MSIIDKSYKVTGFSSRPGLGQIIPYEDFIVTVTKEKDNCTLSLCKPELDIMFTIPFTKILKELKNDRD